MTKQEAFEMMEDLVRTHIHRPPQPSYYLHLCHDGARESFCGKWVGTFVGTKNAKDQHEVIATPVTIDQWGKDTYKYELCPECVEHEDYPLFLLGAT